MSALVNSPTQHRSWIPGILARAASTGLALAIIFVLAVASIGSAHAQGNTLIVLYSFAGSPDGYYPTVSLVRDAQANLYGTTAGGGTGNSAYCPWPGCGTVFKVDASGNETVLYSFIASTQHGNDGENPRGSLVLDAEGNLYGTTSSGGTAACDYGNGGFGCGTVFKVDASGNETVLYSFTGTAGDGNQPVAGLARDDQGNLYGTTAAGGDLACNSAPDPSGCGTVFKVDPTGRETVLHVFTGPPDGAFPRAGLIRDAQGNYYGTTYGGGNSACAGQYGCGTVFKLDPTGKETVLYKFAGGADGANPSASLVLDAQGNLYGTTNPNGDFQCQNGCGTVFKVDPTGKETVLYSFKGSADGAAPYAGLILDAQGNLYGTTYGAGNLDYCGYFGCGTVFKVDQTGKETVLYSFTDGTDGAGPLAGLVLDAQGNLYGTTAGGPSDSQTPGNGTVFKLMRSPVTSTTLTASPDPSLLGKVVTFTATVSSPSVGTPTGTVTFFDGTVLLVTEALDSSGIASYVTSALPLGFNSITAVYGGDSNHDGSTSSPVNQLVLEATTSTTLSSSTNPSAYGQPVTFTATVTSKFGAPPDGEAISFMKTTTVLGTGVLSGGSARFTTSMLKPGVNAVKAVYSGDSKLAGSSSKAVSQVVNKALTTTTLASSPNPSNSGQSVTFTASVTPQFSGTVTGKISFYDGPALLKTESLTKGAAKLTTSTLAVGTHTITATYSGNAAFVGSSAALAQTVN